MTRPNIKSVTPYRLAMRPPKIYFGPANVTDVNSIAIGPSEAPPPNVESVRPSSPGLPLAA
jgi:hypothetical protein